MINIFKVVESYVIVSLEFCIQNWVIHTPLQNRICIGISPTSSQYQSDICNSTVIVRCPLLQPVLVGL